MSTLLAATTAPPPTQLLLLILLLQPAPARSRVAVQDAVDGEYEHRCDVVHRQLADGAPLVGEVAHTVSKCVIGNNRLQEQPPAAQPAAPHNTFSGLELQKDTSPLVLEPSSMSVSARASAICMSSFCLATHTHTHAHTGGPYTNRMLTGVVQCRLSIPCARPSVPLA